MGVPTRLLTSLTGVCSAMLVLAAPALAAGDDPVLQGPWTLTVTPTGDGAPFSFLDETWKLSFGEGCTVGAACKAAGGTGLGDKSTSLEPDGPGYRFTGHLDLDCYDPVSGALTTTHGADYEMVGTLGVSDGTVVDGVDYVTALTGRVVETITVNQAGLAGNCTGPDGETFDERVSDLTGSPDQLPTPPAGGSSDPAGIGPGSADASGTIPGFTLPLSRHAHDSVAAVADGRRSSVPGALMVLSDAARSAGDRLAQDLLVVAVLGLLMVFPAQLFNSTYEENHERIERFFRRFRRRRSVAEDSTDAVPDVPSDAVPGRVRRMAVFLASAVLGTVLAGLLDPDAGTNRPTAALLVGVFAALLVAVGVATATGWAFRTVRHHPHEWYLRAIPSGLVIAVGCVLVSRMTHFAPGYLYGLLGGAVFAGVLAKRTEGRVEAATLVTALLVAVGAWVAFEPVADAANGAHPGLPVLVADSFLGSLFIGGIEGLLFSLIPLRFLPGHRVKQWGWLPWALLTAVALYFFVHVLLLPSTGYLGRSTSASTTVTLLLFGAFGLVSVLFWAWFRLRPEKSGLPGPSTGPPVGEGAPTPLPVPIPEPMPAPVVAP
jgi:hypothetical protein